MNWTENNNKLNKKFEFKTFKDALSFMVRCGFEIEDLNHHPTWTNTYNKIEVSLTTHDTGNTVTEKDFQLAERMDDIYTKHYKQ
jgi:4a-hydroxytetrahydrobiopterin dehydratase